MRRLRVPRDGGMILTMLVALAGVALLPVVFMAALTSSADTRPHATRETLRAIARPVAHLAAPVAQEVTRGVARAVDYLRAR